jgi:hypothetical protein
MFDTMILFFAYGDSEEGKFQLIVAVQSKTEENANPSNLKYHHYRLLIP